MTFTEAAFIGMGGVLAFGMAALVLALWAKAPLDARRPPTDRRFPSS